MLWENVIGEVGVNVGRHKNKTDLCHCHVQLSEECVIQFQANRVKHNSDRKCTCRADNVKYVNGSWVPSLS